MYVTNVYSGVSAHDVSRPLREIRLFVQSYIRSVKRLFHTSRGNSRVIYFTDIVYSFLTFDHSTPYIIRHWKKIRLPHTTNVQYLRRYLISHKDCTRTNLSFAYNDIQYILWVAIQVVFNLHNIQLMHECGIACNPHSNYTFKYQGIIKTSCMTLCHQNQ